MNSKRVIGLLALLPTLFVGGADSSRGTSSKGGG